MAQQHRTAYFVLVVRGVADAEQLRALPGAEGLNVAADL